MAVPALRRVLTDPALATGPARLVPRECEFHFARPIRPTREIALTATVEDVARDEEGEVAVVRVEAARRRDLPVFEGRVRFVEPRDGRTAPPPEPASDFVRPSLAFRTPAQVRDGAPFLGDAPADPGSATHTSSRVFLSHALGLAYAAKAIRDSIVTRDPYQLKRISARLVRPLRAGELLHTAGWIRETRRDRTFFEFEVLDEDGGVVVAEGKAQVVLR
jgi:acyl-coenzyme A thioesterase PaaI-like protein